jgi:hypothetical protein
MTTDPIEALGPAFADWLRQFLFCCSSRQSVDLLNVSCRGLLSDLDRTTCEPIALHAGVAVRTLQEFLRDHVWSFAQVRDLRQQHVAHALPDQPDDDRGTVGIVAETRRGPAMTSLPFYDRAKVVALLDDLPDLGPDACTALEPVLMILLSACCMHQRYFQGTRAARPARVASVFIPVSCCASSTSRPSAALTAAFTEGATARVRQGVAARRPWMG